MYGTGTVGLHCRPTPLFDLTHFVRYRILNLCLQIIEDTPDVDVVVVPVGGAGLIAGVACAVKTLKPECKVRYICEYHVVSSALLAPADSPLFNP
jgi:hypothetical protein